MMAMAAAAGACGTSTVVSSTAGSIYVGAEVSGTSVDTSFAVILDGDSLSLALTTGAGQSLTVEQGTHSVELTSVASNCQVEGDNPRSVDVVALTSVTVTFQVSCATSGTVKVTIATTGPDQDDLYTLLVDQGAREMLVGPNQFVILTLSVGTHTLQLTGVADNCAVQGANPMEVESRENEVVGAGFAVACTAIS